LNIGIDYQRAIKLEVYLKKYLQMTQNSISSESITRLQECIYITVDMLKVINDIVILINYTNIWKIKQIDI